MVLRLVKNMSPSPTLQEWGFGRVFFTGPCLPKITNLFIGKVVAQSFVHIGVILGDGWPGTPLSREWGGTPHFEVQD